MNRLIRHLRFSTMLAWLVLTVALVSCRADGAPEQTAVVRFSVIPDWNKGQLAEDSVKLAAWLSAKLGVEVRYEPSSSYTTCVNALAANKIDFAWLGGKTTCDAIDVGRGAVHVLATRDIDLRFKSYFIGNRDAVANGKLSQVADLAKWRDVAGKLKFTFGSVNSTSGHLMPRHFLQLAGIDADKDFASTGYAQGGHAGTLQSVASGSVDCGALNYAYYDKASAEDQAKAPILFVTPEYVDYAWVAHDRIGKDLLEKLRSALLGLDRARADEAAILDAWSAGKFLMAKDQQWDSIRQVRDSLPKGFLK
jgi:phosphonate transport system substrate-binding protein